MNTTIQSRAQEAGYTKAITIHTPCETLTVWTRPTAELDSVFAAIDSETGERLTIAGWAVDIEPGHV